MTAAPRFPRPRRWRLRPLDLVAAGVLVAGVAVAAVRLFAPAPEFSGRAEVIDGDSLRVAGREVRLHGIDAPELAQSCERAGRPWPCGEVARRHLAEIVGRDLLVCTVRDRDRFGRTVADCRVGTAQVGRRMVADGYALAYGAYAAEEAEARAARRGVWAGPFQPPGDWRQAHPRAP